MNDNNGGNYKGKSLLVYVFLTVGL